VRQILTEKSGSSDNVPYFPFKNTSYPGLLLVYSLSIMKHLQFKTELIFTSFSAFFWHFILAHYEQVNKKIISIFIGDKDADILPYPLPSVRKKSEGSRSHQKYFVLTSHEARDAKTKYAADKAQKIQEKEQRMLERQINAIQKQKEKEEKAKKREEQKQKNKPLSKRSSDLGKKCVSKKTTKKTLSTSKTSSQNGTDEVVSASHCFYCRGVYGAENDEKADDDWLQCVKCGHWFHESCAELSGVLDDAYFTCKDCI
jgi:hypothetical protein